MFDLPTSVSIEGKEYRIRNDGDFRTILDCFLALQDSEIEQQERIVSSLIIFYEDINSIEDVSKLPNIEVAVSKMFDFFNCGMDTTGTKSDYHLVDWEKDSMLIVSAINGVINKEIRLEPYIHWWTFMSYYISIGRSMFSTVLSIRSKIAKGKKLEKDEKEFKRENPQYFRIDMRNVRQKEEDEFLQNLWKDG